MTGPVVYDARVRHRRHRPAHHVDQSLRLAYLDLDELPGCVDARRGWSTRPGPFWFRRRDYLDGSDRPLRDALVDLVEDRTGTRPSGPVRILTQLRTFGWLFNPLTVYYCFAPDGRTLTHVVLEVTNTPWHERFWYVLGADEVDGAGVPFAKQFHVSPFLPMDLTYRCRFPVPGERLLVGFELTGPGPDGTQERVLDVTLAGRREAAGSPRRFAATARAVTQTVRVSAGIYAHALALRLRGATFHGHPGRLAGDERSRPGPAAGGGNEGRTARSAP